MDWKKYLNTRTSCTTVEYIQIEIQTLGSVIGRAGSGEKERVGGGNKSEILFYKIKNSMREKHI